MPNVYRKCILNSCEKKVRLYEIRKFFGFPKDTELRKKWCKNLRLKFGDYRNKCVCSDHFHPCEYGQRLKNKAVPTLNLDYDPLEQTPYTSPLRYRQCCFAHCKSTSETHTTFSFPHEEKMRKLWATLAKVDGSKEWLVCSNHFSVDNIKSGKRLAENAIPTENLTEAEEDLNDVEKEIANCNRN